MRDGRVGTAGARLDHGIALSTRRQGPGARPARRYGAERRHGALFACSARSSFALDAETAHRATIARAAACCRGAACRPSRRRWPARSPGCAFPRRSGSPRGSTRMARCPTRCSALGFGFVEVGTLTPRPQQGNPQPAAVPAGRGRSGDQPHGVQQSRPGERARRGCASGARRGIVGVNIGANKDSADRIADYVAGVAAMAPVADYLTVNISSPNTPGLRNLQAGGELVELLGAVAEARAAGRPAGLPQGRARSRTGRSRPHRPRRDRRAASTR